MSRAGGLRPWPSSLVLSQAWAQFFWSAPPPPRHRAAPLPSVIAHLLSYAHQPGGPAPPHLQTRQNTAQAKFLETGPPTTTLCSLNQCSHLLSLLLCAASLPLSQPSFPTPPLHSLLSPSPLQPSELLCLVDLRGPAFFLPSLFSSSLDCSLTPDHTVSSLLLPLLPSPLTQSSLLIRGTS